MLCFGPLGGKILCKKTGFKPVSQQQLSMSCNSQFIRRRKCTALFPFCKSIFHCLSIEVEIFIMQ